jgi:hypothetical protein
MSASAMTRAEPPRPARTQGCSTPGPGSESGGSGAVATPKERAEQKRREKLALIRGQLESGELTIRQMTPAERAANPPRPAVPRRRRA